MLAHQQYKLPSKRRPDLLCRIVADTTWGGRVGDWVVIELKSTRFTPAALDQVAEYRSEVAQQLASPGEDVIAVLVTDGATQEEIESAEREGVVHLSTAHLGYRYAIAD
jgi:predicted metal-dependent phosphoesterase TrpH